MLAAFNHLSSILVSRVYVCVLYVSVSDTDCLCVFGYERSDGFTTARLFLANVGALHTRSEATSAMVMPSVRFAILILLSDTIDTKAERSI